MRHKRIRFGHLQLNGIPVSVRYGDLLVAQDEACGTIDWEVLVTTPDSLSLEPRAYDVHIETAERQMWGPGLLVRTDGRAHVFRGGGHLDGFSGFSADAVVGEAVAGEAVVGEAVVGEAVGGDTAGDGLDG